jgi:F0F1-type ATP synthase assembly protein I
MLEAISGLFLGIYIGFFLMKYTKVSFYIYSIFLLMGLIINLVNVHVYHKKYENLLKSLDSN